MQPAFVDTSAGSRLASADDFAVCTAMLGGGSRTFYLASYALPAPVRTAATALYAFCRMADDAVDTGAGGDPALQHLHQRLDSIYAGRPAALAVDRALAAVVEERGLPRTLLDALLEGFQWDLQGRRYESLEDLAAYAARVAGSVGAMMAVIMERREDAVVARACDLGVAMQLTNIARDVAEDARMRRLYLPQRWLIANGIDPVEWLAAPAMSEALLDVIVRLLDAADDFYERATRGIAALPVACRPAIHAARLLYAGIGDEVRRLGPGSWTQRATVSRGRKTWLLAQALAACTASTARTGDALPAAATRFLVDAVVQTSTPRVYALRQVSARRSRLVGTIELFERLQRRQTMAPAHRASVAARR